MMSWQRAVEDTVIGLGYELVDAEKSAGGLLRVFIDHLQADHPARVITVDDCERVTRQLQHVLEVEGTSYARLEVSSPGLDRPLKKPADYTRFVGEQIEVTLKVPFKGRKKYRGELQARDDGGWRLVLQSAAPARKPGAGIKRVLDAGEGAQGAAQALDFALDEVREACLVPVLDFKGHRFAAPLEAAAPTSAGPIIEVDGGRIQ